MDDLRVTVKIRNNLLVTAIEESGHSVGGKFADCVGINYPYLLGLVNMTITPLDKNGDYKEAIFKLCEFLNKMPDELFSESQKTNKLEVNKTDIKLNSKIVGALGCRPLSIEDKELQSKVDSVLATLTDMEARTLSKRFGLHGKAHTLKEVAEIEGITSERVRQIEAKALRKLRHPKRSVELETYMYD